MNDYDFPPYMIDGAWFYRETLFAQMAGVAPIQLDPESGEVKRRSHFGDPDTSEKDFDPEGHYYSRFRLFQGNWITGTGPGVYAKITRSGLLERVELDPLSICLGWTGVQSGDRFIHSANDGDRVDQVLEVSLITGEWTVFKCHKSAKNRHLRIAKNGDYFGAIVVLDAVDAFITGQSEYLVTKHHDEQRSNWWLECRLLNDLERVLWRTEACGWMTWFMGTGDTVWHTEWCGPGVKGKDWLIGRDLVTGAEIYRKAEACRFMGLFCGPLIITASARSITAWEAIL